MRKMDCVLRIFSSAFALLSSSSIAAGFIDVFPHQAPPSAHIAVQIDKNKNKNTTCIQGQLAGAPDIFIGNTKINPEAQIKKAGTEKGTPECIEEKKGNANTIWIEARIPDNINTEGWQHVSVGGREEYDYKTDSLDHWMNFQIIPIYDGIAPNNYELVGVLPHGNNQYPIDSYINDLNENSSQALRLFKISPQRPEFGPDFKLENLNGYKGVIDQCDKTIINLTVKDREALGIIIEASRLYGDSAGLGLAPNYMGGGISDNSVYLSNSSPQIPQLASLTENPTKQDQPFSGSILYILDSENYQNGQSQDYYTDPKGTVVRHGKEVREIAKEQIQKDKIQVRQICNPTLCKVNLLYKSLCEIMADKIDNHRQNIVVNMSFATPYDVPLLHYILRTANSNNIWLVTAYGNLDRCNKFKKLPLAKFDFCNAYPADWLSPIKDYSKSPPLPSQIKFPKFTQMISVGAQYNGRKGYERIFSTSITFSSNQPYYGPTVRAEGYYDQRHEGTSFATPIISSAVLLKLACHADYKLPDSYFKLNQKFILNDYLACE